MAIGVASAAAALPTVDATAFAAQSQRLANGVQGEIIVFTSRQPADWAPLLAGAYGPSVRLNGQLFRPRQSVGSIPAVVIVPGSGGVAPYHLAQAATLTNEGMAAFVIDPFHGRGIGETVSDQGRLTWAASANDVAAAVRVLRERPGIDPDRIGAAGSSRGATAVMMAAMRPLSDALLGPSHGLRAVVAGYPWCGTQFRRPVLAAGASLLVLSGDRDDWVSLQQCQDAVHALASGGSEARIMVFPGALQAFDRAGVPPTRIEDVPTSTIFPTV